MSGPAQPRPLPGPLQAGLWLCALALTAGLGLRNFDSFQTGAFRDDTIYAVMARSVAHPDRDWLREAPGLAHVGSGTFPPGYPLALAPLVALFPDSLGALKAASLAATLLNMGLLFWGWRLLWPGRSHWWGLAISALYGLWPWTIQHSTAIMSEALFLTVLLAAMLLAARAVSGNPVWGWQVWFAAALAALVSVRSVGWFAGLGPTGYLLLAGGRPFRKDLARIGLGLALTAGLTAALAPGTLKLLAPARYLARQGQLLANRSRVNPNRISSPTPRLLRAVPEHLKQDFREAIVPLGTAADEQALAAAAGWPALPSAIGVAVSGALAVGAVYGLKRERWTVLQAAGLAYLPVLFLWLWQGPRFLYPILPQIQIAFLLAVELAAGQAARAGRRLHWTRMARNAAVTVVTLAMLANFTFQALRPLESRPHIGELQMRTAWLRANTPEAATVMTEEPRVDYLYGGRRTAPYPELEQEPPAGLAAYLRERKVDYVLVAPHTRWQIEYAPTYSDEAARLLAMLADPALADLVEPVYVSEDNTIRVFRVRPGRTEG